MKTHKWSQIKKQRHTERKVRQIERKVENELFAEDLKEMRKLLNKTQEEIAEAVEMSQSQVSRMEGRKDHKLSTMRRLVQALGGELEVSARFGKTRIRLFSL